jgi:hypothetical protein
MIVSRRSALSLALCAILTLPLWNGTSPAGLRTTPALAKTMTTRLYLLQQPAPTSFLPMDPETLADLPGAPTIYVAKSLSLPYVVAEPGGSLLAVISVKQRAGYPLRARDVTVRVVNALTFNQVARFHPKVPIYLTGMSADGLQLYGFQTNANQQSPVRFDVLNARNGAVVSRTLLAARCCPSSLVDLPGHRLYVLEESSSTTHIADVASYDLSTGQLLHRQQLDGVLTGVWDGQTAGNASIVEMWMPGFALSPDGRSIAVLDGESDTLHIVDAGTLQVIRSERLSHPQSLFDRVAGWLGLAATTASAKEFEGVSVGMRFSPDGQSLYVSGRKSGIGQDGAFTVSGLGLRKIDVTSGAVTVQALKDASLLWLQLSPDGKALYTIEPGPIGAGTYVLRRLDATTLKVTAERTIASSSQSLPQLFLLPTMTS